MQTNIESLITYDVTSSEIAAMRQEYLALRVANINDKGSYELCHKAQMVVRSRRIAVENRRKELKADSLEFGRQVDARAKAITAELEEIESHLKAQKAIIDDEKKRIAEEAERKRQANIEWRGKQLAAVGVFLSPTELEAYTEESFAFSLQQATMRFEAAERERQEREAELEKLRALQAEQLAKQAQIEAENARLIAEVEAQKARERAAEDARLKAEREALEAEKRKAEAERLGAQRQAEIEAKAKAQAEAEAAAKVADEALFNLIKAEFPTLEGCWVEIARLRKLTDHPCF